MLDPKKINEIISTVISSLPPGLKNLPKDAQENLHATLQSAFTKLDLVTRDEFDAQSAVLQRTRAKLEALEQKIKELEQQQQQD